MNRNIIISTGFHFIIIMITTLSLPFLLKTPIELPPIISIELIQITDKTSIPFAPKAKKIIEKIKKKETERVVSEQAPPKKIKKEKPDAVPLPNEKIEKVKKIEEKKQNPEKIETEIKQVSEFEKKELFDPNNIAALIDKSKENFSETILSFSFFSIFSMIFLAFGANGITVLSVIWINSIDIIGGRSIGVFVKNGRLSVAIIIIKKWNPVEINIFLVTFLSFFVRFWN